MNMKKMLLIILALFMLVVGGSALADERRVSNPVPDEIAKLFDVPAWEGYEIPRTTTDDRMLAWRYDEEMDAGIVIQSNGSLHVVCIVERDSKGNLRITARNYTMVTGDRIPTIEVGEGSTSHELSLGWGVPMFELYGCSGCYIAIGEFNSVWRVKTVLDYRTDTVILVNNEKIGYILPEMVGDGIFYDINEVKYAYGTYDNRFAAFNIHDFPRDLEEARAKLTNPPSTPSDFYSPVTVSLRASEKYDVFAAPGRSSYRAANGKAVMSTNDWVQIFGEENGWLLVQYDISRDHMRFGYIDSSALPRGTTVQRLNWYDLPLQTIKHNVSVTDDPLVSGSVIHSLTAGDEVKVLSSFGNWYYIETVTGYGKTLRGFVPKTCIDLVR